MAGKIYKSIGVLGTCGSVLAGCVATPPALPDDTCGASRFQSFIGQPVSALAHQVLRSRTRSAISFYGESQVPARTVPSDTLGTITYKNKFEITPKQTILVIYDDQNGRLPYQGKDPRAEFIGAVENTIKTVTCGRR